MMFPQLLYSHIEARRVIILMTILTIINIAARENQRAADDTFPETLLHNLQLTFQQ